MKMKVAITLYKFKVRKVILFEKKKIYLETLNKYLLLVFVKYQEEISVSLPISFLYVFSQEHKKNRSSEKLLHNTA